MTQRKSFPAPKPIDEMMLRRLFATHGSAYAIAKRLGCTAEHVRRQLKKLGIPLLKPGEHSLMLVDDSIYAFDHGIVATWLRTHPGIRLPQNVAKIAEMIGCTRNDVSTYFYRRRKRRLKQLDKIPDLRVLDLELVDDSGAIHPTSQLATYRYSMDKWNLSATIEATLLNGMELSFPLPVVEDFEEAVVDALQGWSASHPGLEPPNPPNPTRLAPSKGKVRICTNPHLERTRRL